MSAPVLGSLVPPTVENMQCVWRGKDTTWMCWLEFVFLPFSEKFAGVRFAVLFFCLFSWFCFFPAAGIGHISGKYINYQMISLAVLVCLVFSDCIWIIGLTFCCSQYVASSLLLCLHLSFSFEIKYRHDLKIQFCKMLGTISAWSLSCRPHKKKPDGGLQDKNILFLFIVKDWSIRWRFGSCLIFLMVWEHTYFPMAFYRQWIVLQDML